MPKSPGPINGWPETCPDLATGKLFQGWVPEPVDAFLKQLCLPTGWRQFIVASAVTKLAKELERRGLTPGFSPENRSVLLATIDDLTFKPKTKKGKENVQAK